MNHLEAVRKYKKMYKQLLATADELAGRIESNDVLCCDITLAQPGALLNAVAKHVKEKGLTNVKQHIIRMRSCWGNTPVFPGFPAAAPARLSAMAWPT